MHARHRLRRPRERSIQLKDRPDHARTTRARANRGDELFSEKRIEEALTEYAAAARLAPEIEELRFWQAVPLASIGREAEALPIFETVFKKSSAWAELVPRLPAAGLLPDDPGLIERILRRRPLITRTRPGAQPGFVHTLTSTGGSAGAAA